MSLSRLRDKLEKLFYINKLICSHGEGDIEALFVIEDEVSELHKVYQAVQEQLEKAI